MNHLNDESILSYVAARASEAEQMATEGHMAQCADCCTRVRLMRSLREEFDSVWETFTAADLGSTYRKWRLSLALQRLCEKGPALASQARRWLRELSEQADATIDILVDGTKKLAMAAKIALPSGYGFRPQWAMAGVGAGEEREVLESHLTRSSELLGQNQPTEATRELLKAIKVHPRIPQAVTSEVYHEGRLVLQVSVESRRREVIARYWPIEEGEIPGLLLLLPDDVESPPLVAEFRQSEDEPLAIAELGGLPDGTYTLNIGPTNWLVSE